MVMRMSMPACGARRLVHGFAIVAIAALVSGCAPSIRGDSYHRGDAMRAQSIELGIVENMRPVTIEGYPSGAGTATGAVIGGLGGSQIGSSSSSHAIGAILGAVIGGIIGNAVERDANRVNGAEVTVRLDSGRLVAVVQEGVPQALRPGDRVRVLSDGYTTRVTH
jgi:outer membrane lipoprotein SlyB